MTKTNLFLLVFLFPLLVACISTSPPSQDMTLTSTGDQLSGWYAVYFTDPDSPTASTFRGGPDSVLADAIRDARLSVDVAIYHLDLWSIRDALMEAYQKGVQVRMVTESDNMDELAISELQTVGIEILGDRRESFMHQKFVIIDKAEVWTGSMNFTLNGAYRNNNNLICIRSSKIAENFTNEFEEMFIYDMFGDNTLANTPHPQLNLNNIKIETLFSPDDNTEGRILSYIEGAKESIKFMIYSFTSDKIAQALLTKANQGLLITGVFEETQYYANIGTEYDTLLTAGLDVRLDGNRNNMHHKVMIIDDQIAIVGSYNFSRNAEMFNDENTLIIVNQQIAVLYLDEFNRIFSQAMSSSEP